MENLKDRYAVAIAGGGPTGLMLAAELALAGVDAVVFERRADQALNGARAGGLHSRSIEILDQRGVAERFLAAGQIAQVAGYAWNPLDISDLPSRHPYGLALWQTHIERLLAEWIEALGAPVYRGLAVTGLSDDGEGVEVGLSDGRVCRADWLVGCDGGRSLVRKAAGIGFPGWDPSVSHLIAELETTEPPPLGLHNDAMGIRSFGRMGADGPMRVMVTEQRLGEDREPTLADLSTALVAVYGRDFGIHSPVWISRFTDMSRQAEAYRKGRVLLAGDAAHIHYPAGGQGLNTGLQDAVNLGWKLAQVVRGTSPDSLLDSYHAERHPVGARVLRNTMAQVAALRRQDERDEARAEALSELLRLDEPRQRFGAMISGLDIRYDLGEGHPLLGRRMPDLDLETAEGVVRVATLLHAAQPLLIDFGGGLDIAPWTDRVRRVAARYDGAWRLPLLGETPAPADVLVRPDGHVGWVGEGGEAGLAEALSRWFGPGR